MYSSTLSSTSALHGRGWSTPRLLYPPGKTRYPMYKRLGGPQSWSWRVWKISPPPGFDPRTVQPVASRYTDWYTGEKSYFFKVLCLKTSDMYYVKPQSVRHKNSHPDDRWLFETVTYKHEPRLTKNKTWCLVQTDFPHVLLIRKVGKFSPSNRPLRPRG